MDMFTKDNTSGAFINNNNDEYLRFKAARQDAKKSKDVLHKLNLIEEELREIKALLLKVLGDKFS